MKKASFSNNLRPSNNIKKNTRTVFLINPASGAGHLDSYCRLYTKAFIELGWHVKLLSPCDGGTTSYIASHNLLNNFEYVYVDRFAKSTKCSNNDGNKITRYEKMKSWKRNNSISSLNNSISHSSLYVIVALTIKLAKVFIKTKTYIHNNILCIRNNKTVISITNRIDSYTSKLRKRKKWFQFSWFDESISRLIKENNANPDFLFIMYLDSFNCDSKNISQLEKLNNTPWAGILFAPNIREFKLNANVEKYFSTANCRGSVFLVPKLVDVYQKLVPNLFFQLVPDVADIEIPSNHAELKNITEIQEFAKGRKIVSLLGTLMPHKGVVNFIKLSKISNPNKFCFIMIGKLSLSSFSHKEQILIQNTIDNPTNLFIRTGYLSNENEYNSLFKISDIIYAVYRNFDSSSNTLTKAAGFFTPILADSNSTVGDRVVQSNIGEAVDRDNIDNISTGLERLSNRTLNSFDFESFNSEHSFDNLKLSLSYALNKWLK